MDKYRENWVKGSSRCSTNAMEPTEKIEQRDHPTIVLIQYVNNIKEQMLKLKWKKYKIVQKGRIKLISPKLLVYSSPINETCYKVTSV